MSCRMVFTPAEREKMGVLVNNLSVFAAQLLTGGDQEVARRAIYNLGKVKQTHEALLRHLDKLALQSDDESALRLIEDLGQVPANLTQILAAVRRCLSASAFLGHCIAHGEVSGRKGEFNQLH